MWACPAYHGSQPDSFPQVGLPVASWSLSKSDLAAWEAAKSCVTAAQQAEVEAQRYVVLEPATAHAARKVQEPESAQLAKFESAQRLGTERPKTRKEEEGYIGFFLCVHIFDFQLSMFRCVCIGEKTHKDRDLLFKHTHVDTFFDRPYDHHKRWVGGWVGWFVGGLFDLSVDWFDDSLCVSFGSEK